MSNFFEAGKAAMTSNKDDWETPQQLFDLLDRTYHFTLDPCSTDKNAKCAKHYTIADDGMAQSWEGETVFCNPPYGRDMYRWVQKCAMESRHAKVVMLIPARTDTRYFHDFIYRKPNVRYEFLRGRLKFEVGGGLRSIQRLFHQCLCSLTADLMRQGGENGAAARFSSLCLVGILWRRIYIALWWWLWPYT